MPYFFDLWILHAPPINLYNIDTLYNYISSDNDFIPSKETAFDDSELYEDAREA